MRHRFVILILVMVSLTSSAQDASGKQFHGTLPQALLLVDQTFHVSVLGEIVDPIPSSISIKLRSGLTAEVLLKEIVTQCPGYVLLRRNDTFVVAQKELLDDRANPMNEVLRDYRVPDNLGTFRLAFPNDVVKSQQGIHGTAGGVLSGPQLPAKLSPTLKQEVLHNLTAREILIHVAGEVGNLYSILILPSPHPVQQRLRNTQFQGWEIAGGPGVATYNPWMKGHPGSADTNE